VRIIGGRWKRTPLAVPDRPGLRPTGDRVRGTLFNWLTHLLGDYTAVRGLDLFAGSGALGLELASRGAQAVTLVERDPALARQIGATVTRLGGTGVNVICAEALAWAARQPAGAYGLVFLDPPFAQDLQAAAMAAAHRLVAPHGLVYLEGPEPLAPEAAAAAGYELVRAARAGRVAFHLLRPAGP
jgi:16S rRNA (guanine(966)-N(2))-methyltransferase RsmD